VVAKLLVVPIQSDVYRMSVTGSKAVARRRRRRALTDCNTAEST